jgi:propanol-preferring alcohol dehydrogenase
VLSDSPRLPQSRRGPRLVELDDPVPAAGELVLAVAACAVCRTDLQLVEGDLPARALPVVPGHQVIGRVIGVGSGVEGWRPGDRAGVGWLAGVCGRCARCAEGRENLCADAVFTGWDRDGGYATRLAVKADFALPIPDGFDDTAAAPLLCGGVIGYRSLRISGILPGGRLGLFGFGASALLALQVAGHWGCEVHVRTRSTREQERAIAFGAATAGGYDDPTPPLDAAVTFAPSGDVVVAALRSLDRGGTVAVNAIHLDRIPEFAYDLLWWERGIRSVANFTRDDARAFLGLAAAIPIRTEFQAFALEDGNDALAASRPAVSMRRQSSACRAVADLRPSCHAGRTALPLRGRPAYRLAMTNTTYDYFEDLAAEAPIPARGIHSQTLSRDGGVELVLFAFAAGEALSEHTSARPTIVHVLTGEGELTLGEDRHPARAGAWARMPARLPHSIVARTPLVMALYLLPVEAPGGEAAR